ncbi:MAG: imidazole glycerol phosphate synthase subunit HisH [Candidatus Omnitrophica bacterium]|nr:imidazole glycerol phosphate synthase subunit HisH [Candidatus Omnitrophota bacterium]
MKAVVVDYHMGNLFSVRQACEQVGFESVISSKKEDVDHADAIILPGVGAFGVAMEHLKKNDLVDVLKRNIEQKKPFLGVCLGFQLLMDRSTEFGEYEGLGVFRGSVKKFPARVRKIPHVGWNTLRVNEGNASCSRVFKDIGYDEYYYFVHSYYVDTREDVLTTTDYEGFSFCSAIAKDHIWGLQFHPEKSARQGLKLYENFFQYVKGINR